MPENKQLDNVIAELSEACKKNVDHTFSLLRRVMGVTMSSFPSTEIRMNGSEYAFSFKIAEHFAADISTSLNTSSVTCRVFENNNNVVAECITDITGGYRETYVKMPASLKTQVYNWFTEISAVVDEDPADNTEPTENTASDGTPVEQVTE